MIVILMGYMGSGKSTVGKALATALNYRFVDLDDYIAEKERQTIVQLFKSKGEIYFRKKETEYLKALVASENNLILALGGGTPCYANNINMLMNNPNLKLFYLKYSIPILAERLFDERQKRPLISHLESKEALQEFIGKHLFERVQYYSQATFTIQADGKSPKEVLEAILMKLI